MGANLLVTCGGKWVGMILHLKAAMNKTTELRGQDIFVADRERVTPAGCFADHCLQVPPINDPSYEDSIIELCLKYEIRVIVPIIDLDLIKLAPRINDFASVGTTLVAPPEEFVDLCFDKALFDSFARKAGLQIPQSYKKNELKHAAYPLFGKQRRGFGSINTIKCATAAEAISFQERFPDTIFQQYINADEISVDAFVSATGKCIICVQRIREKVVGGEVWRSRTIMSEPIGELASATIEALALKGLRGPMNVQIFNSTPPQLIEVNTRLGSGSVFSNFASNGKLFEAVLSEACGNLCDGDPGDYITDLCLNRYLGDVYHDGKNLLGIFPGGESWIYSE